MGSILRFWADEGGGTALEYVILASMIAIFTLGALTALSVAVTGRFDSLGDNVSAAGG